MKSQKLSSNLFAHEKLFKLIETLEEARSLECTLSEDEELEINREVFEVFYDEISNHLIDLFKVIGGIAYDRFEERA